jgi:hypothetical protein
MFFCEYCRKQIPTLNVMILCNLLSLHRYVLGAILNHLSSNFRFIDSSGYLTYLKSLIPYFDYLFLGSVKVTGQKGVLSSL